MKLNLGCGPRRLDGFVNLDLKDGWSFQDGLGDFDDATVDGITVSHALMYVPIADWPVVFAECARVLKPGGVMRVTEDATDDRRSDRFGGWRDAVTLTSRSLVKTHMEIAGLEVSRKRKPTDGSLVQAWHGVPPKVFAVEGLKL